MLSHHHIQLPAFKRGFHLITDIIQSELERLAVSDAILHLFIQHTSAGICINENADPTVLWDFDMVFNKLVPEKGFPYAHTLEGDDDMPAHIKSVLCGTSVSIPVIKGKMALGVWQGIYLCEFRNNGGKRKLVLSVMA